MSAKQAHTSLCAEGAHYLCAKARQNRDFVSRIRAHTCAHTLYIRAHVHPPLLRGCARSVCTLPDVMEELGSLGLIWTAYEKAVPVVTWSELALRPAEARRLVAMLPRLSRQPSGTCPEANRAASSHATSHVTCIQPVIPRVGAPEGVVPATFCEARGLQLACACACPRQRHRYDLNAVWSPVPALDYMYVGSMSNRRLIKRPQAKKISQVAEKGSAMPLDLLGQVGACLAELDAATDCSAVMVARKRLDATLDGLLPRERAALLGDIWPELLASVQATAWVLTRLPDELMDVLDEHALARLDAMPREELNQRWRYVTHSMFRIMPSQIGPFLEDDPDLVHAVVDEFREELMGDEGSAAELRRLGLLTYDC